MSIPQTDLSLNIVEHDGYVVDADTGEIIGHIDAAQFTVTDRLSAEWVLERMAEADALAAAEQMRLAAVTANIEHRIKAAQKRRNWLQLRFGPELQKYAENALVGAKSRTLVLDHGRISFARSPGSIKIANMPAAVSWAQEYAPLAIKTVHSVLVSELKGMERSLPADVFSVQEPYDRCTVDTGITKRRIEE